METLNPTHTAAIIIEAKEKAAAYLGKNAWKANSSISNLESALKNLEGIAKIDENGIIFIKEEGNSEISEKQAYYLEKDSYIYKGSLDISKETASEALNLLFALQNCDKARARVNISIKTAEFQTEQATEFECATFIANKVLSFIINETEESIYFNALYNNTNTPEKLIKNIEIFKKANEKHPRFFKALQKYLKATRTPVYKGA